MTITRIKQRRGTAAAWTAANPTLDSAEFGVETDTGKIKLGDGSTAWTALNYLLEDAALEGTPTAPTAAPGTDTTQIATTAFVGTAVDNATSGVRSVLKRSAVFSVPNATEVAVPFDVESRDLDDWHTAGANTRLTVPAAFAGHDLRLTASLVYDPHATGQRAVEIRRNGTEIVSTDSRPAAGGSISSFLSCSATILNAVAGDYYEVVVYQTAGVALNSTPFGGFPSFEVEDLGFS